MVEGQYTLTANDELRFEVGTYDPRKTLVIDPTLNYLAAFGGTALSEAHAIAVDSAGNAYVTGLGGGTGFPTTPGAFQPSSLATCAFVRKVDPSGAAVYSTDLGGSSGDDQGYAIAVDASGDAYVTGITASTDFPTTPNAFQPVFNGGGQCGSSSVPRPCPDGFVTKVAAGGTALLYSTYLGGSEPDYPLSITVDTGENAYVAGGTDSIDFPVLNAFQGSCPTNIPGALWPCGAGFVSELDPSGSALVFSTYLGGSNGDEAFGIALDSGGTFTSRGVQPQPISRKPMRSSRRSRVPPVHLAAATRS